MMQALGIETIQLIKDKTVHNIRVMKLAGNELCSNKKIYQRSFSLEI